MADEPADIVVITGLSGAGRSTVAKSLEDLGWFVVDNLPPGLLPTMVDLAARSNGAVSRMAAVVDVRSRAFSTDLKSAISDLGARGLPRGRGGHAGTPVRQRAAAAPAAGQRPGHRRHRRRARAAPRGARRR